MEKKNDRPADADSFGGAAQTRRNPAEEIEEKEKQAHDLLMHVKDYWERIFDAVPDLILIVDKDYRIVTMNAAMSKRLGLATAEVKGTLCYETVHVATQPPAFCPHLRILGHGEPVDNEIFFPKLNGYFRMTISSLFDEAGGFRGTVHVFRDISARKADDQKIQDQLDELRRWHTVMLDREDRIQELKREVNELCQRYGEAIRYSVLQAPGGESRTDEGTG